MAIVFLTDINKMQDVLDAAIPGDVIEIPRGTQTVTVAPQKTRARKDMFAHFIVRVPKLTRVKIGDTVRLSIPINVTARPAIGFGRKTGRIHRNGMGKISHAQKLYRDGCERLFGMEI